MKFAIVLFALLLALLSPPGSALAGTRTVVLDHRDVVVVDGDTILVGDKLFNLFGIDAPELGQQCYSNNEMWPCGREAAELLHKAVSLAAIPLQCSIVARENATDEVTCAEVSKDLSLMLLNDGLAAASADAPFGYRLAEKNARAAHLGIWRDAFVMPADWRKAMSAAEARTFELCPFLGQLYEGVRVVFIPPIDHSPVPDRADGRIFCSDDEAVAEGWQLRAERK